MKTIGNYSIVLMMLLFTGVSLSGCKVAHMALPQGLQGGSSEMTVEGRSLLIFKKEFHFGPYDVTDVHRGWTRGKGFWISGDGATFSDSEAKQKYEFSVSESGQATWDVRCDTEADWNKIKSKKGLLGGGFAVEFASSRQLVCALKQEGSEELTKLVMKQSANDMEIQGVMTDGATQVEISVTHKLDTTPLKVSDPTGYIFRIDGRPVGAVEVINKGTVWLDNSVAPEMRSALAATSAALLLYQNIKENLERH